ncbi:LacI family DNA-binding transcriptional regulator [Paenibacillus filicis]|uniref:LacI family DNA-binding transcriptional regulator n=1 Tax=Paenibacillus gyeongsangnamensis TaxID=3388067 RepID=A0ABT4QJ38_9BACL|nr:LacI family DNA-binding transcriptional regulator [Paenibacillus filicis]MCZ8516885.1 LacI family DNA-binding transcriptional regulator [Paenibacillus filicis]
MATIKDVAKLAGVAVSTASCALNGDNKVKSSTRLKVLEAAKRLNYQKNGFAMDLKRSSTQTIAVILEGFSGPYFSELLKGVQDITSANRYSLIACSSHGDADSTAIRFLKEKRADGVIVMAYNISDELLLESTREGFPIILLNRHLRGDFIFNVTIDDVLGAKTATDYLIQAGHKEIAFISGPANSQASNHRYIGYKESLKANGLKEQPKWVLPGKFTRTSGYKATKTLILQGNLPTAVFYGNDEMAVGGLKAFEESGIKVPDDISIIGFDDIELAEFTNPPLTTIRQPKYEMGTLAAHLMFQALGGGIVTQDYNLPTELIERESCRTFGDQR